MEHYVVTITRQFGSMGRPIARKLSEILGVEYYDRDIVEKTSAQLRLPVSTISNVEENVKNRFFQMKYPLGNGTSKMQDQIFQAQRKIILELAEKESCILVGRCADSVLSRNRNAIHVYIYADHKIRLNNCIQNFHMTEKDALKMMADVDKARLAYHKMYAGYAPNDIEHKNLLIDSGLLGVDQTAEYLAELVEKWRAISI